VGQTVNRSVVRRGGRAVFSGGAEPSPKTTNQNHKPKPKQKQKQKPKRFGFSFGFGARSRQPYGLSLRVQGLSFLELVLG
jgi:hypothetical protein